LRTSLFVNPMTVFRDFHELFLKAFSKCISVLDYSINIF
jgi:hypothetical protein